MNPILEDIYKKRVIYVHALEVNDVYELESCVEQLVDEFIDNYNIKDIIDFITTLEIYYLGDDEDEERRVFNFDVENKVKDLL
jgi:hypothetical protein